MADDYDNMTEDQLSALRGDSPAAPQPQPEPVPEPELPPAEPEAAPEPEPAPVPEPEPDKPYMIPKSRYDAVMGRLRAAEAKLQETQARVAQPAPAPAPPPAPVPNVDDQLAELDNKYTQALADGQYEEAAKLMAQSRQIERQMFSAALSQVANQTRTQANSETREQLRYESLLAEVERAVPQVAPDSDAYDEGLVAEISHLANAFERVGERPADALEKAMSYVFPQGWRSVKQAAAITPQTRATDVAKNLAAAKAIPPKMVAGENSDKAGMTAKIDIMKLSDAELDKLTEDQLARLRGDDF